MKKSILLIFIISILFSCSKDDDIKFESSAKITGYDMRKCACCGGWLIEIEGVKDIKHFDKAPKGLKIDLQDTKFPVLVNLNWTKTDTFCGNGIIIDKIELR